MRTHTNERTILILLLLCLPVFSADPPCKTRPDVTGACFRVRGNLLLYNGTPSARISVKGSTRVLGVVPYFSENNETFAAPAEVRKRASFDQPLMATYDVCPLSKPKPRVMLRVCIEAAEFDTKAH
jgi:hypothetical protein